LIISLTDGTIRRIEHEECPGARVLAGGRDYGYHNE
jgi:hypothetical protein